MTATTTTTTQVLPLPTTQVSTTLSSPIPQPSYAHLKGTFKDSLPTKVQVTLDQPFGKDNINQSVTAEPCLRHILLPLFKSGYVGPVALLEQACKPAYVLCHLLLEHNNVDFSPLRGYPSHWDDDTDINDVWVRMITAAFLHYVGCAATVVHYIGALISLHIVTPMQFLLFLHPSVDPSVLSDLERIFKQGTPNYINAHSSETNFQAFRAYGNHGSVNDIPEANRRKMLVKSFKRGYVLVMDKRLIDFIPNMHLTPQGIVDLDHPYKNPLPIFDSSCQPQLWCHAINDWTDKSTEPELIFATGFMIHPIWLWNQSPDHIPT